MTEPNQQLVEAVKALSVRTDIKTGAQSVVMPLELFDRILAAIQATDGECQKLRDENRDLREIVASLGYCTPDASLDFMRLIPAEVAAVKAIVAKAPRA